MKLSIFTGIYASDTFSAGGSFIYERLKKLKEKQIPFSLWIIQNKYSALIEKACFYVYNRKFNANAILWNISDNERIIVNKVTPLSLVSSFISLKHINHLAIKISNERDMQDTTVIHAHWMYPSGYLAMLVSEKLGVPLVVTAHGSDIHTLPHKIPLIKKYTLQTLEKANKVIFVSHALLDSAIELGYSGKNAVVIPNGINEKYFYSLTKEEALVKTGWKQTHKYVVGFVGNLISAKRADKFVDIFSYIQKMVFDVEFVIIGDGGLKDKIMAEISDCKIPVTFVGRVPHETVGYWMNLFDVLILPSRQESWGCVIHEAYACGIPVVGSSNGGIPETLGGLCPSVIEGNNFERRYAETVCDVLTKKIVVEKEKLISWALEHTWDRSVDKEIEIYREVINSAK